MQKPEFKTLDLNTYPRKEHFLFFKDMLFPYLAITANVDLTKFLATTKKKNLPFFLTFLYFVINSANKVKEFRLRIKDGGIIEYDYCLSSHIVLKEDESYAYCTLDCSLPFEEYLKEAIPLNERAKTEGGIEEDADALYTYFISCLPWINFSALIQPIPSPADSSPRITWGKMVKNGKKTEMSINIQVNHALMDGIHISHFLEELQKELDSFIG